MRDDPPKEPRTIIAFSLWVGVFSLAFSFKKIIYQGHKKSDICNSISFSFHYMGSRGQETDVTIKFNRGPLTSSRSRGGNVT